MKISEKLLIAVDGDLSSIDCGIIGVYNESTFVYDTVALKKGHSSEDLKQFLDLMDSIPQDELDGQSVIWLNYQDYLEFCYDYESCNSDAYWWKTTYVLTPPKECF